MKKMLWLQALGIDVIFVAILSLTPLIFKTDILPTNYIFITPLLLVFGSYRYGFENVVLPHIVTAIISATMYYLLYHIDFMKYLLIFVFYAIIISIPGLFAKNIHRTLNNRRYKSVYLNIVTSLFISTILISLVNMFLLQDTYKFALQFLIVNIIYCLVMARVFPKLILPRRSQYLSSKERSKLLND